MWYGTNYVSSASLSSNPVVSIPMIARLKQRLKPLVDFLFSLLGYQVCLLSEVSSDGIGRARMERFIESLHPYSPEQPMIRLGPPNGDGGYLLPDALEGITACFSPGVSNVSGFEKACAEMGMKVFMADHSVDAPAEEHLNFHFIKKFVGGTTSGIYVSLGDWVREMLPDTQDDLMLQMDIEGQEYEVIFSASGELLNRFRIMIIEFHDLNQLWSRPFFQIASRAFEKILETHVCVHLHPNNCCGLFERDGLAVPKVMEFTFLRRDYIHCDSRQTRFPNPLDRDNTPKKSIALPECWYRKPMETRELKRERGG